MNIDSSTFDELFLARQNLAQKLVSRHEDLTHTIARDLHDVVIAELMLLKRTLSERMLIENDEISGSLEVLSTRLREICYDLAPRDLEDWGLQTIVEDLLERISKRIGADFSFHYEGSPPRLERPVQLHVYRIVQECLNNVAKYANATYIEVQFVYREGLLKVSVLDNGSGFTSPVERTQGLFEGGMGLSSINERTEMIRCFHPATLSINSDPGQGTIVTLEISVLEG
jgi:signal transduction histidine kinase